MLVAVEDLRAEVDRIWRRATTWVPSYRQLLILPLSPCSIPPTQYEQLFPEAAIPSSQCAHGFPMVDAMVSGAHPIYHLAEQGFIGVIPQEEERPPGFAWTLQHGGAFLHREILWEESALSITLGHTHVGSLLQLALAGIFFLRRLVSRVGCSPDTRFHLELDLLGMRDRGVVAGPATARLDEARVDAPPQLSQRDEVTASIVSSARDVDEAPLDVAYSLVAACLRDLRPDLCAPAALSDQLRRRYIQDQGHGLRFLGFLAGRVRDLGRRGVVSLSGHRVGLIEETRLGSRFLYDEQYLKQPGAVPISPTLPLRPEPYERHGLLPFFANLLPEGEQREIIAQQKKIAREDLFGLLLATGPHSIGAVEVEGEAP